MPTTDWTPGGSSGHPRGVPTSDDDHRVLEVLERSRRLGALGPGPVADHVRHADGFLAALASSAGPVLDLGSGGGVPGLVIAVRRPDLRVELLDAQSKRVELLRAALDTLGLADRCTVHHGRAEELAHRSDLRGHYGVVVARSFGPPAVVAECAVGFLTPGGHLVVSDPPGPDPAARWPSDGLAQLDLRRLDGPTGVTVLERGHDPLARTPRRAGIPVKRPLF